LWFSIVFCTTLGYILHNFNYRNFYSRSQQFVLGFVIIILGIGYFNNFTRAMPFSDIRSLDIQSIQVYSTPLTWLKENIPAEQVIWVPNLSIATYIPILTKDFVLFHPNAASYLMPSAEIEERYLVSKYFDNLTVQDLERDVTLYAGAGVESEFRAHNREVEFCKMVSLKDSCGVMETTVTHKGKEYFTNLYNLYTRTVIPHINEELAKYHVSYILVDKENDHLKKPIQNIKGASLVYTDSHFEIYHINR
jgi:hypothetical protein